MSMEKIFKFDNNMGYRWGSIMWLCFFIPSFTILLADSTTGPARDYLGFGTLMSCVSYMIYTYYFYEGYPASTPGQITGTWETVSRWVLAAYLGPQNLVNSSATGVMNGILLVFSGVFMIQKLLTQIYVNFNRTAYLDYQEGLKEHGNPNQEAQTTA